MLGIFCKTSVLGTLVILLKKRQSYSSRLCQTLAFSGKELQRITLRGEL